MLCSLVKVNLRFAGISVGVYEWFRGTQANVCHTAQCHVPEDSVLYIH